ncbi:hypothetical protein [Allofournierella sp.]|uniref:hypothetical protein n=1 Tax=Allofournierella sp. TaxID=1940256 RepID=UPI003AB2936C
MKHKMSKKVLCLCMVAVLAIGLAIPTFAGTAHSALNGTVKHYRAVSSNGTTGFLNLYPSNGVVKNGTPLKSWTYSTSSDQYFKVDVLSSGHAFLRVQTAPTSGAGGQYSLLLNRSTNGNAIVWDEATGARDSALQIDYYSSASTVLFNLSHYAGQRLQCPASGSVPNGTQFIFTTATGDQTGWVF